MRGRTWGAPLVCAALLLCAPVAARADGEISTDRPDVSDNTKTVPRGALQIETGLEYAKSRVGGSESERRLGVQLTLRAGLTERFEVQPGGEADDAGHGDLVFAAKHRFLDALAARKGIAADPRWGAPRPDPHERLADIVGGALDVPAIAKLVGLAFPKR